MELVVMVHSGGQPTFAPDTGFAFSCYTLFLFMKMFHFEEVLNWKFHITMFHIRISQKGGFHGRR